MKVFLIDNYDSFTFNVVHLLRQVGVSDITVKRNTALNIEGLKQYDAILASPGPGLPMESGSLMKAVSFCLEMSLPYLGICLGHQALGRATGAKLQQLSTVKHGVQESCTQVQASLLLAGLPTTFELAAIIVGAFQRKNYLMHFRAWLNLKMVLYRSQEYKINLRLAYNFILNRS